MGTGGISLGVKRPDRETNYSPPSSVEVKECVELYLRSANTSLWCGDQLITGSALSFYLSWQIALTFPCVSVVVEKYFVNVLRI